MIGTPTADDEILAALPVCAPWGALGRYKYKIKLQPGSVKKGKAVKEIVGRWVSETTTGKVKKDHAEDAGIPRADAERVRAREGELIKGWKETEIINTMPVGKVRIMTAGNAGGTGGDKGKGKGGAVVKEVVVRVVRVERRNRVKGSSIIFLTRGRYCNGSIKTKHGLR